MRTDFGISLARLALATVLIAMVMLPLSATTSSAHLPVFDSGGESYDTADRIENLETSFAFYGELPLMTPGDPEGSKYYVFEGKEGQELKFEIGKKEFFFAPCVLLVGPGLPNPDKDAKNIINSSGLNLPAGSGALGWSSVFLPFVIYLAETEFEPFTQTTFYYAYSESVLLPSDGTYYFIMTGVVYSEELGGYQISSGKYFLVTGYEEEFTVLDFVLMPWYWLKVQSFWSEHGEMLFILPTAAVLLLLLAAEAFRLRKDEDFSGRTKPARSLYFVGATGSFLMIGGAVHQISLLIVYSGEHEWEGIAFLVLSLQLAGIALGVTSARFVKRHLFNMKAASLTLGGVIVAIALVLGAGVIIGPLLFFGSLVVMMLVNQRVHRGESRGEEDIQPQDNRDS